MTIALCIPTYNARDKLERCVESVLRHTQRDAVRITIINDGSSDDTAHYLDALHRHHPDISTINLEVNHFKCRPLNMALQQADSEFILFLDDDTEVTPGWMEGLLAPITGQPRIGMVGAKILFPDDRIFAAEHRVPARLSIGLPEIDKGQRDYIRTCDALVGTCYLMRTELRETVGWYDETLKWHEDIDYSTRARLAGYQLVYNGYVRIYHHHLNRESGDPVRNLKQFDDKWADTIHRFPLEDSHIADKLFARAFHAFEAKDWNASLDYIEQLEAVDQRYGEPYIKGKCLYALGRLDEAITALTEECDRIPTNIKASKMLIQAYKALGRTDALQQEARRILTLFPELLARDYPRKSAIA